MLSSSGLILVAAGCSQETLQVCKMLQLQGVLEFTSSPQGWEIQDAIQEQSLEKIYKSEHGYCSPRLPCIIVDGLWTCLQLLLSLVPLRTPCVLTLV